MYEIMQGGCLGALPLLCLHHHSLAPRQPRQQQRRHQCLGLPPRQLLHQQQRRHLCLGLLLLQQRQPLALLADLVALVAQQAQQAPPCSRTCNRLPPLARLPVALGGDAHGSRNRKRNHRTSQKTSTATGSESSFRCIFRACSDLLLNRVQYFRVFAVIYGFVSKCMHTVAGAQYIPGLT